jgi:hypothetical protein
MLRLSPSIILALAVAGLAPSVSAFSLLGPYATWETADLSYNLGGIDAGGPMNLGEEYRWNVKTITYGFTKSFQDYFGQRGIDEINKAVDIFNSLPPVSKMSADLSEFPQDTRRINYQANTLGLYDLKSFAMGMLTEEIGLADPERYVWTLRSRFVTPAPTTNYFVIMRNFDPVTWNPTPYVNGVLYTYNIIEAALPAPYADALEATVDPLAIGYTTVAGIVDSGNPSPSSYFSTGVYFTGLTRDDVGGIRYLLHKQNLNVEGLPPNAVAAGPGGAWSIPGAGAGGSNSLVTIALRPGVEKIVFKQINFYGAFPAYTNIYTDTFYDPTNNRRMKQKVAILQTQPDILFTAGDLGLSGSSGQPFLILRTDSAGWANNSATNTIPAAGVEVDGPGVIQPPIVIAFSTVGPFIVNQFPGFVSEANNIGFFGGWAAIDGTTNPPYIFPNGASIQQLEEEVFKSGGQ